MFTSLSVNATVGKLLLKLAVAEIRVTYFLWPTNSTIYIIVRRTRIL